eukprot:scaffold29097_cov31-Tisochrysis_lutea.AAC.1
MEVDHHGPHTPHLFPANNGHPSPTRQRTWTVRLRPIAQARPPLAPHSRAFHAPRKEEIYI